MINIMLYVNTILFNANNQKSNVNVIMSQQQSILHIGTDVCHHSIICIVCMQK